MKNDEVAELVQVVDAFQQAAERCAKAMNRKRQLEIELQQADETARLYRSTALELKTKLDQDPRLKAQVPGLLADALTRFGVATLLGEVE